jgi:hypothetical protein
VADTVDPLGSVRVVGPGPGAELLRDDAAPTAADVKEALA